MGFQNGWRGPNIVSDGLVLYLDAGSPNSYRPDFGTTWKDMSGNVYNGTLINGPTYSSANGGSIVFDGSNDYVGINSFGIPNNNGQLTLSFWVNYLAVPSLGTIIGDGNQDQTIGYIWIYNDSSSNITYQYATNAGRLNMVMGGYMTGFYNTWINMVFVVDYNLATFVGYRNGSIIANTGLGNIPSFPSANRSRLLGAYSPGLFFSSMLMGPFMMHAKTLTPQEVLQNYNAQKSRFGL